jgi:hypothetical protein
MAQHDYNIANQSGADFRADLNNALSAIATVNSGASEPSTTFAHQLWVDTSNNVLKIRNAANSAFISTGVSITASNAFNGTLTGTFVGNATTATTLETPRTINGTSFDGSANISFNTDSVAEGSSNLYFTNERVDDQVNALLQAGTGIQLTYDDTAGTLTIANTNDADITGVVAGNGLTGGGTSGSVTLNVAVDDSSIEIDSDALRVKASGITNTMLAGSIANSKLANSSVTINSQSLALGGTLVLDTDNIGEGSSNLYYTTARANTDFDSRLATKDTGDLTEGSNLYYTTARVNSDFDTRLATKDTDDVSEGTTNLYYTTSRTNTDFDTRLATKSTTNLAEGTNLYYTTARFDSAFTSKDTDDLSEGSTNLYYTQSRFDSAFGNKTTANLTENTNLYYTDTRANSAIDARVTKAFVDALGIQATSVADNSVVLGNDTTGNYIQTITGTANKITVSGSGSESADVTLTLPDDVQIASDLTVAGNLTVNGTLTSLDTTNLDIEDNLFQLNAGLTGSPVNDSGMLINRGTADNGIFMWDESVDKFTLGLTTADGSATGNITLSSLGTLVANIEGNVTGAITGTVSSLSNHDTDDLTEGSNLYYTQARFDSALAAKSTSDLSEGTNLYYTDARFDTRLASKDTDDVSEGTTNLYYTTTRFDSAFSGKSTSDLSEGSNLYYTDARVQAISINNVVEDTTPQLGGDLDLNSSDITGTGDINITGTITSSGNITGTLATAAQPNITSVGTLTGLNVAGTPTFDGLTVDGNARIEELGAIAKLTLERGGSQNNTDSAAVDLIETNAGSEGANFGDAATNGFRLKLDGSANDFLIQSGASGTVRTRLGIDRDTGDISFYEDTGSTAKFFWDASAESLGIGTTSPSGGAVGGKVLHLVNSGGTASLRVDRSDASTSGTLSITSGNVSNSIYSTGNKPLNIATNSTTAITIDATGNVGIGATPKAYHSDYKAIDINNSASVMGYTGNNGAWLMENLYYGTDNNWKHKNSDFSALVGMYDGVFNFYNTASGTAGATATLQNRLKIDQSGNVGIGNTSPANKLAVNGGLSVEGAAAAAISEGLLIDYSTNLARFLTYDSSTGSEIAFYTQPSGGSTAERVRIDSSGNVDIKSSNLYLTGSDDRRIKLSDSGTNGVVDSDNTIYIRGHDDFLKLNAAGNGGFIFTENGSERMRIDSSGRVGLGSQITSNQASTYDSRSNDFVISGGGDTGMTIAGGSTEDIRLVFTANGTTGLSKGSFTYDNANDTLAIETGGSERMRITSSGFTKHSNTGTYDTYTYADDSHQFVSNDASHSTLWVTNTNTNYATSMLRLESARVASSAFNFLAATTGNLTDDQFLLRGDGNAYADGSWNGGGADYAEYFEWSDGNTDNEDRRGYTVVLSENKIRKSTSEDNPNNIIGVVSGNPSVIGDSDIGSWKNKYQKDDYGSYIKDENGDRVINDEYDENQDYVSREDRKEWDIIGLMGKVRINKGQTVGDRWIKMRDISDTIEEWLIK